MVRNTSFADYIADWRRLLVALEVNTAALPDLSVQRPALEAIVTELEAVVTRQDAIRAESSENAQEARQLLKEGADVALQIRSAMRAHLGPRNPKLAEFRVRVLGVRRRAPAEEAPPPVEAKAPGGRRRRRRRRGSKAEAGQSEPKPAA